MSEEKTIILRQEINENEEIDTTKCFLYSNDVCRSTFNRDCLKCAIANYKSMYGLNWDNQRRLGKEIDNLESQLQLKKKVIEEIIGDHIFDCWNCYVNTQRVKQEHCAVICVSGKDTKHKEQCFNKQKKHYEQQALNKLKGETK